MNQAYRARWLFTGVGEPIPEGVLVVADGRIVAIEANCTRSDVIDLGNVALVPGLCNLHTHLDLTGFANAVPPGADFPAWLTAIVRERRARSPDATTADVRTGLAEALAAGTTLLADIDGSGCSHAILAEAPLRSVVYREVLGLRPTRAEQAWADWCAWERTRTDTETCRLGISPHAPYSVHKALYRAAATTTFLTTHLAESIDERTLLEHHDGPFVTFLKHLGVWEPSGLMASFDALLAKLERTPSVVLAHCGDLPGERRLPANMTVAYCPRTHRAFGRPPHPFREMLTVGTRVALGTDSRASNPDLDVWAEAVMLHQHYPDVSGAQLLRMATLTGAEALGWERETGSLEVGKSADAVAFGIDPKFQGFDAILEPGVLERPRRTLFRGVWRGA